MTMKDGDKVQRTFKIEPPMHGNAFRVIIDKTHKSGANIQGRFDLWALPAPDFKPADLKPMPKRAMADLNGVFTASSQWDKKWAQPGLDSPTAIYNARGQDYTPQWWAVDLPGDDMYQLSAISLKKRQGGNSYKDRVLNAF